MKKNFSKSVIALFAICLLIIKVQYAGAQDNIVPANVCLWEIENQQNKIYLLGSIHLLPEDVYPLDERISNSFNASDILVVEADITQNPEELQKLIAQKAFFSDSTKSLKKVLPEELYSSLSAEIESYGVDMAKLNNFKPWFVALNLNALRLSKIDVKAGEGVDLHFLKLAQEKTMKVQELESVGLQLEMLSSQTLSNQIDNLQYILKENNSTDEYLNMLGAWEKGDSNELNNLSRVKMREAGEELPGLKEQYKKLFTEREDVMLEKITSFLNDNTGKTYFVVVGIFHLVGEDGLIRMLKEKGYKAKQL